MKNHILLMFLLLTGATFQTYASEAQFISSTHDIENNRSLSVENTGIITAQEKGNAAIKAEFAAHLEGAQSNISAVKGIINYLDIKPSTSSSTVVDEISKQLSTPLNMYERSLLTKALNIARQPNGNYNQFNYQINKIQRSRPLPGNAWSKEPFTETQLLNAINKANQASSLSGLKNMTKTFLSHVTTLTAKPIPSNRLVAPITFTSSEVNTKILEIKPRWIPLSREEIKEKRIKNAVIAVTGSGFAT